MQIRSMFQMVMVFIGVGLIGSAAGQQINPDNLADIVQKQSIEIKELRQELASLKTKPQELSEDSRDMIKEMVQEEVDDATWEDPDSQFGQIDIHGFISQGFIKSYGNEWVTESLDGTYEFNEIALNFSTQLTDELRAGVQLFSRDYGDVGNNEIYVDWAYGDYRWQDWMGFRAGILRTPFGFYNETRDIDLMRPSIFLPQGVYNEFFRDALTNVAGVGVYGNLPTDELGDFSYTVQTGAIGIQADGGLASQLQGLGIGGIDAINDDYIYIGSLTWNTPLDGLRVGTSHVATKLDIDSTLDADIPIGPGVAIPGGTGVNTLLDNLKIWLVSAEYTWNNLVLSSEYMLLRTDLTTGTDVVPALGGAIPLSDRVYTLDSWYANAAYRFTDWLEAGSYYCYALEADSRGVDNYSVYSRFDLSDNVLFKLEAMYIDGTGIYYNSTINTNQRDDNWWLFAGKFTFNF